MTGATALGGRRRATLRPAPASLTQTAGRTRSGQHGRRTGEGT
jgi:hypothetical protein